MLTFLAGIYLCLIVLALASDSLLFQPQPSSYTDESLGAALSMYSPPGQVIHLHSGGQTITAFYLPNPNARFTLLFSHGNAEDIGNVLPLLRVFYDAGFSVFAYDYRGYGTSSGKPSEQGVYDDLNAAYNYLANPLRIPPDRIIAMAHSLGCGAATHLAATRPVAGLVLESPFLSAFRVVTRVPILPWDKFNNAREIRKVHVPVLIVHGRNDETVPFWHGERLFEKANQPRTFLPVEGVGHNDLILMAGGRYAAALRRFAADIP